MPDLGTYAVPVLSSYAIGLGLVLAITAQSLIRARQVKRALEDAEGGTDDG
jgi:heme exporter protein D